MQFKVGQRICWKAAGKVSRLDGVAGEIVSGVIESIDGQDLRVKKDYSSIIPSAVVPADKAKPIKNPINPIGVRRN